MTRKGSIMYC